LFDLFILANIMKLIKSIVTPLFADQSATQVHNLTPQEFWQIKETQHPVIIDVRTLEEVQQGYIEGALHIPLANVEQIKTQVPDKDQLIILYCRSGHRASVAEEYLEKAGYTQVYNAGGLNALLCAK